MLAGQKKTFYEIDKNCNEIKQEFEISLKNKYELDCENKELSKKLEKINENVKFNKEGVKFKRSEEIKNLQSQVFYLIFLFIFFLFSDKRFRNASKYKGKIRF